MIGVGVRMIGVRVGVGVKVRARPYHCMIVPTVSMPAAWAACSLVKRQSSVEASSMGKKPVGQIEAQWLRTRVVLRLAAPAGWQSPWVCMGDLIIVSVHRRFASGL